MRCEKLKRMYDCQEDRRLSLHITSTESICIRARCRREINYSLLASARAGVVFILQSVFARGGGSGGSEREYSRKKTISPKAILAGQLSNRITRLQCRERVSRYQHPRTASGFYIHEAQSAVIRPQG